MAETWTCFYAKDKKKMCRGERERGREGERGRLTDEVSREYGKPWGPGYQGLALRQIWDSFHCKRKWD